MAQQESQVLVAVGVIHHHRRREIPQQRQHRSPGIGAFHTLEDEVLLRGGQLQQAALLHLAAVAGQQRHVHRDVQRPLAGRHRMAFGIRQQLCQRQHQPLVRGIVLASHLQPGRAGGGIPAQELSQVTPVGIGHGRHEGLAGHGLAVVALEIEVHAAPEAVHAQQRLQHADDFCALLVDGGGVEVVDGLVAVRADGVAHRAGIFGELHLTQHPHVAHALHGPHAAGGLGIHAGGHLVGGELLVAEHRQPFLQRQLEPVAAGDAVAGPVVEVLMPDDRFDPLEVRVGGHEGVGEHVLGVEDVQTLVLHRPHVEVRGGHDHEAIQVQFQPEAAFVPGNGLLQTAQREVGTVDLLGLCPDLQQHLASRGQPVAGLVHGQIASHQREEVAGFRERVFPDGLMPVAVGSRQRQHRQGGPRFGGCRRIGRQQIAVGQQHRVLGAARLQDHPVGGHHVRPVLEPGDAPEALCLALGEQGAAGGVQAGKLQIGRRMDAHLGVQREVLGQITQHQLALVLHPGLRRQYLVVNGHAQGFQRLAVQSQRGIGRCARAATIVACRRHHRVLGVQGEMQHQSIRQPVGLPVVFPSYHGGLGQDRGRLSGLGSGRESHGVRQEDVWSRAADRRQRMLVFCTVSKAQPCEAPPKCEIISRLNQ